MYQAFAFVIAFIAALPAAAQTARVKIDGVSVALVLPAGHCRLERGRATDRPVIQTVERITAKTNRVLASFADCAELEAFRGGRQATLDNFGQYMTPRKAGRVKITPAAFAQEMTDFFKSQGAEVIRGAEADTRERIGTLRLGIAIGETRMIGVLRTDEHASYLGIVQNLKLADGSTKLQVGVSGVGLIKGRVVTLNLYSRFTEGPIGAETTMKLLEKSTQSFAAAAGANAR